MSKSKLTIIADDGRFADNREAVLCRCECGNICRKRKSNVITNQTKSCGCIKKEQYKQSRTPLIGKKFGKLEVLSVSEIKKNNRLSYNCLCDCGRSHIVCVDCLIRERPTVSCGMCNNMKNGRATSNMALKLHKIIGCGEHNYYTDIRHGKKNWRINVDFALVDEKIAIEYDGWYYHQNTEAKDISQTIALIKNGWKVLRIKSARKLPTKEQIDAKLNILRKNNSNLEFIFMGDRP